MDKFNKIYCIIKTSQYREIENHPGKNKILQKLLPQYKKRILYNHKEHYNFIGNLQKWAQPYNKKFEFISDKEIKNIAPTAKDLIISCGGDGTFLNCAQHFSRCTLLGINSNYTTGKIHGSIGALTCINKNNFQNIMQQFLCEQYSINFWKRLAVEINDKPVFHYAVNDIYIGNKIAYMSSDITVCTDTFQDDFSCSGVIVCTGMGSTAWFANAGGTSFRNEMHAFGFLLLSPSIIRNTEHCMKIILPHQKFIVYPNRNDYVIAFDSKTSLKVNLFDKISVYLDDSKPLRVITFKRYKHYRVKSLQPMSFHFKNTLIILSIALISLSCSNSFIKYTEWNKDADLQEIKNYYETQENKNNTNAEYYSHYAQSLVMFGSYKTALQKINSAIKYQPFVAHYHYTKGEILVALKEFKNSLLSFKLATEYKKTPQYFYRYGEILQKIGKYQSAEHNFLTGLKYDPDGHKGKYLLLQLYLQYEQLGKNKNWLLEQALLLADITPHDWKIQNLLTNIYLSQGQDRAAFHILEKWQKKHGRDDEILLQQAAILFDNFHFSSLQKKLQQITTPTDEYTALQIRFFLTQDKYLDAHNSLKNWQFTSQSIKWRLTSEIFFAQKLYNKMEDELQKIPHNKKTAQDYYLLSLVAYKKKQFQQANEFINAALILQPSKRLYHILYLQILRTKEKLGCYTQLFY